MLAKLKAVLGISVNDFDDELTDLIESATADLGIAGITRSETLNDPLIRRAVITYCVMNHGNPENYDRLLASYEMQKGQLQTATRYTDWGDGSTDHVPPVDETTDGGESNGTD